MRKVLVIEAVFSLQNPERNARQFVNVVKLVLGCPLCGAPAKDLGNGSVVASFFHEFLICNQSTGETYLLGTPESLVDAFYQGILFSGRRGVDAFHVCPEEGVLFRMTAGTIEEIRKLAQAFFQGERRVGVPP